MPFSAELKILLNLEPMTYKLLSIHKLGENLKAYKACMSPST